MSFALTIDAVRARTKTVTRRHVDTWRNLRPGDRLRAVDRVMGFRKGERAEILATIEVVDVREEPLRAIFDEPEATAREGLPHLATEEFCYLFMRKAGVVYDDPVRRIEYRYVDEPAGGES